jgi:hypothetical protein
MTKKTMRTAPVAGLSLLGPAHMSTRAHQRRDGRVWSFLMGSAQRTRVCACLCGKKARNRLVVKYSSKQSKARDRQGGPFSGCRSLCAS